METQQSIRERLQLRLGPRLIGLVVLTALVAGGLVGLALIQNSRTVLREGILESNLATADLAAQFAAEYVEGAETNLRQFATRPLFLRAVLENDLAEAEMHLAQFLQIDARFDNIAVYDAQGIGWASGLMDKWQNRGGSVADREWFQQTLVTRKPCFGIPVISRGTGHAVGVYAVPIFDDQGEIRAVLVGGISLAALSDAITGLRVSASARASLLDARQGGLIVAHSDPQRILTPVTEQDAAALRAIAGERGTMETRSSSGELALAAFAPVPRLPWAVVILEPAEAAFAPVNALTQRALLLIGITMLIAAVLGVLLARTITQPVRQLVKGAEEIGRGNLEYRIQVGARDEIGQLAGAFNEMAARRKRAEEALWESEQWLSTTLRSIGDAVVVTDAEGLVTLMNPVAEELTGWAEAVGQPLEDVFNIINEQTGERAENPVARVIREGVVVGLANHTVLIAKDGTKRPIADSGAPMQDEKGNIIGTVMVFRDITEQVQAERELRLQSKVITNMAEGVYLVRASRPSWET